MLLLPDYVSVIYVIVPVFHCNSSPCLSCIRQLSFTDLALFLLSRRVYQRFGSYVMNIHAPNFVP